MNLKKSEILQVNVTAIAGIMILVTINSFHTGSSIIFSASGIPFLAWVMILPFSVSSFYIIYSEVVILKKLEINKQDELKQSAFIHHSLLWMAGGFAYIIVFLGVISIPTIL